MVVDEDVCALIPTLDEEGTIGAVIDGLREQGIEDVLVVDGRSTDQTQDIARERGARVEVQSGHGKGQAVREGLTMVDADYVLMLDGDGTYLPEDAEAMLRPLLNGECEHVIGNRFADMESGAMPFLNRVGNRLISGGFGVIHGRELTDILSGYRAMTRESIERMHLTAEGFGIETEMSVECVKQEIRTCDVPITYRKRPKGSEANLRPFRDGGIILLTLYRQAKTNNPLFYFGSLGFLSAIIGTGLGMYVGVEWYTRQVSHEIITVVAGVALLVGIQLFIFGALSDMILTLHQEQREHIRRLEDDQ